MLFVISPFALALAVQVAGELEKRNVSLIRLTQQSLGREGDLKQAVNATKQQVRAFEA